MRFATRGEAAVVAYEHRHGFEIAGTIWNANRGLENSERGGKRADTSEMLERLRTFRRGARPYFSTPVQHILMSS